MKNTADSRINFFAGANGSGKTRLLEKLSREDSSNGKSCLCISNTPFDRFKSGIYTHVLRISRNAVRKITRGNLDAFYGDRSRETFELGYLLRLLNFEERVSLTIKPHTATESLITDHYASTLSEDELTYLIRAVDIASNGGVQLSNTYDAFSKSVHGNLRIIFTLAHDLKISKVIKDYNLTFFLPGGEPVDFNSLSSGEQTLITTFLFLKMNAPHCRSIYIDEPENSLHPEWQRKYIEIISAAIGYNDPKIFIATHSPIIISGSLSGYRDDISIFKVDQSVPTALEFGDATTAKSVEEILDTVYDTITPANHYLSIQINHVLHHLVNNKITEEEARASLSELAGKAYDERQVRLINRIRDNLEKIVQEDSDE